METYEREITFLSKQFVDNEWAMVEESKTATFKELSRVAKDQHKLHFMLTTLFSSSSKEGGEVKINSDSLYEFTVSAIEILLIINENFTESDKSEFLNDSGAILEFAIWALHAKFNPFFSTLRMR